VKKFLLVLTLFLSGCNNPLKFRDEGPSVETLRELNCEKTIVIWMPVRIRNNRIKYYPIYVE
jgi:hypothetical protein